MNERFDPSRAEQARERLREEFEQLRGEIEELGAEESGGEDPRFGGGFWGKARASAAVLALTAAIAAAAGNFALNGGRSQKEGSVSVPLPSGEPQPGAIAAGRAIPEASHSLLALIGPGLQTGILGSNASPPSAGPPPGGPSPTFVVGDPVSVSGHGSRGGDVAGADPVSQAPTAPPSAPEPEATQLAFSPPPAPTGKGKGKAKGPGHGGKPSKGGHPAATLVADPGGEGKGPPAEIPIEAPGKGPAKDGKSPGKGHEKDGGLGGILDSGPDHKGPPGHVPGGHGPKGHGPKGDLPIAAPPPPPPPSLPSLESDGKPGKGKGKGAAPGLLGK